MRWVSPALKSVVYPALAAAGVFRGRWYDGPCRVVTYHGVCPVGYERSTSALDGALVSEDEFRRQLRWLKANYQLISPQEFRSALAGGAKLPPRALLLTCDDGHLNNLTTMLPVLREEGVTCLFFVTTGGMSSDSCMLGYEEQQLPPSRRGQVLNHPVCSQRFRLMNAAELQQLVSAGMTIGSHTLSHPMLAKLAPEAAEQEIRESRKLLEAALGQPVWALAYPFGGPDSAAKREWALAQTAGYDCAFMNVDGAWPTAPYAIPRVHVTAGMQLAEFQAHVSGLHEQLRRKLRPQKA